MSFASRSVLTAFTDVEGQLRAFIDRVPLVPEHDAVWSPALASCILEACSQLDSFWKASTPQPHPKQLGIQDHFERFGASVAGRWLVIWDDEGRELRPFGCWKATGTLTKADYAAPPWWQAYNALKHDRWGNIRKATLGNAAHAVGALFLAIIRCPECFDALVGAQWIRSDYAMPYVMHELSQGAELTKLGVTVESSLFSYAVGSLNLDFAQSLGAYYRCTHRFGRWLEGRYKRSVL